MNVVDMHCDTIGRFYFSGEKGETKEGLLENSFQVDLKKNEKRRVSFTEFRHVRAVWRSRRSL